MKFIAFFLLVIGLIFGVLAGVFFCFMALDHNPQQIYTDNLLELWPIFLGALAFFVFPFSVISFLLLFSNLRSAYRNQVQRDVRAFAACYLLLGGLIFGILYAGYAYASLSGFDQRHYYLGNYFDSYVFIHLRMSIVALPFVIISAILQGFDYFQGRLTAMP